VRVSVQQAAQTALQVYLQAQFDAYFGGAPVDPDDPPNPERCVVSDRWPEPDSGLPKRAVSIIEAGQREDTWVQEQDIAVVMQPDNVTGLYTFRVAACRQPLQLDVWADYNAQRDELVALLDDFLHKGERFTLNQPNGNPVRDGVLLALDPTSGYSGFCDFTFDGPRKLDTNASPRVREYRSSSAGFCDVDLTVQALTPKLARVLMTMALSSTLDPNASPPPPVDLTLTLTSPSGSFAVVGT